jgi:hypothetical protein
MIYRGPSVLAPQHPPPTLPLFRQLIVPLSQSSCVSPVQLTDGREGVEEAGVVPNLTTARMLGPL